MDISLGPLLFHWGKDNFYKFYEEMAETDVAVVYLGEVVCADRKGVELEDMAAVAKMLADKGKQVYLSTLGLMATAKEVQMTRDLCALPFDIEANNPGVFSIVTPEAGKKVAAGPHLTLYNTPSVKFMER
ncbi:MAG: U32 family peptidase, partial [Nitrospirota bacterium]|nr:U32 family peptidase [Nitrospirota bacterium]